MTCEVEQAGHRLARYAALSFALAAYLHSSQMYAADSIITVKGSVYAEPCTVSGSSANITIDLGRVQTKALAAAGSSSPGWSAVQKIMLSNCPAGTKTVTAKFDGTGDPSQADTFKNTGTAGNVSVWLAADSGGSYVTIAPAGTRTATIANGAAEFPIKAQLYSKSGGATAGSVLATISVTLSYQ